MFSPEYKLAIVTEYENAPNGEKGAILLSDSGVRVEDIARLVGHSGTTVTETVYRKQIRPVIIEGAQAMDQIFARSNRES
ncbi:hypothetical protein [Saccharopolyspora sp. ASAGF58]|uniref:hypothetical protein n=1 Tax=Saccharopolyspora sp. ASAGF58 TaxID=2719023 RepID=UPI001FF088CD|nr:hypothetical protein [Saccharopolyspora sp. ASAGF58]